MSDLRLLELYSGIGGMRLALEAAGLHPSHTDTFDINTIAADAYKRNFSVDGHIHHHRSIEAYSLEYYAKLRPNIITASPPCQPFTRQGNQLGSKDHRSKSTSYLPQIIEKLLPDYFLLENVVGFESSDIRDELMNVFALHAYSTREFTLSPTDIGIPNSRNRYFLLARRIKGEQDCGIVGEIVKSNFVEKKVCQYLVEEADNDSTLFISKEHKYFQAMDIVSESNTKSCCFTKNYGRYCKGTGSILKRIHGFRKFSPKEVGNVLGFPNHFDLSFLSSQQAYQLLGNSISIDVVCELFKILFNHRQ